MQAAPTGEVTPPRRGAFRWVLLAYVLLLAASHVVRRLQPPPQPPAEEERIVLDPVDGEARMEGEIELALERHAGSVPSGAVPVVLLHGSPGNRTDLADAVRALGENREVFSVDLPGFGASTRDLPDHSFEAAASYVAGMLDTLDVDRVDLVGYSWGGAAAIVVAARHPDRVRSLTLVSSLGIQELTLLGTHEANHALHGVQLVGLWLLQEAVPHFGALDGGRIDTAYARSFYDSDQRPLAEALTGVEAPVLIVHGRDDWMVTLEAARETRRRLPQSELIVLDGGHGIALERGFDIGALLGRFLRSVERGDAPTRHTASAERRAEAARPYEAPDRPLEGFPLFLVMALAALATLFSEDLTCIAMGLFVAEGRIEFIPAAFACWVGILFFDLLVYVGGRLLGRRALGVWPFRWMLEPRLVERARGWFERRGLVTIAISRLIPGIRLATYFAAGTLRVPAPRFALIFGVASAISTVALVALAAHFGPDALRHLSGVLGGVVGVAAVLALIVLLRWWWRRRRR